MFTLTSLRKLTVSVLLALLLVSMLVVTVMSQMGDTNNDANNDSDNNGIVILESGLNQQLPVIITMLVPTETGVQTVTVPLMLNLGLTVGPVEALDLDVTVPEPVLLISPLTIQSDAATLDDGNNDEDSNGDDSNGDDSNGDDSNGDDGNGDNTDNGSEDEDGSDD